MTFSCGSQHPDQNLAMRYFGKSLVYNTIQASDGRTVPFIEGAAGIGLLATEDAVFIAELELRIREKRGGIWEMTQEVYDEELKKKNASQSLQPSLTRQGLTLAAVQAQAQLQSGDPAAAVVPASDKPKQADQTPSTSPDEVKVSKPTVGKLKR
jgi:hypothetical protein